jgi:hypothetical protein
VADNATGNTSLTGFKAYHIFKIQTSHAAWIRVYSDTTSRTNDAGRSQLVDPSPNAGVIAEIISTGSETVIFTPAAVGFSNEITPDTNIPIAVTNLSGGSATINVTLTILQAES